jgi:uncharacterized protein GlcG (DUF336 family)
MSIETARRILEASKQRARELRSPVSIAIVDAGGHLVLFERMMAPYGWATGNISIAKANTAVMFNQSTDAVAQWAAGIPGFASSMATMTDGKFIMAAGGWPIRSGGMTIGGIGVSGGNAPGRDDEIARAGLAAAEAQSVQMQQQPMQQQPVQMQQPLQMPQPMQQQPVQMPQPIASQSLPPFSSARPVAPVAPSASSYSSSEIPLYYQPVAQQPQQPQQIPTPAERIEAPVQNDVQDSPNITNNITEEPYSDKTFRQNTPDRSGDQ